jgi:hypothetical protein
MIRHLIPGFVHTACILLTSPVAILTLLLLHRLRLRGEPSDSRLPTETTSPSTFGLGLCYVRLAVASRQPSI